MGGASILTVLVRVCYANPIIVMAWIFAVPLFWEGKLRYEWASMINLVFI